MNLAIGIWLWTIASAFFYIAMRGAALRQFPDLLTAPYQLLNQAWKHRTGTDN